jgi:hypothetical protein
MKKKILFAILSCVLILALGFGAYAVSGSIDRKNRTLAHLESQGYSSADIQSVRARCSVFGGILGLGLWNISVEFADEPGVIYYYSYEGGEISQGGVNGANADKDALKHAEW